MKALFLDTETDGLEPLENQLLEVAAVVTDDKLEVVDQFHCIIKPKGPMLINTYVAAMHSKNGLLELVHSQGIPLDDAEEGLCKFVLKHWPGITDETPMNYLRPTLAGNTVHFDRSFMKVHTPTLHDLLHYRNFDCATLLAAYKNWVRTPELPRPKETHRAMPDVMESIATAKKFRQFYLHAVEHGESNRYVFGDLQDVGVAAPEPVRV